MKELTQCISIAKKKKKSQQPIRDNIFNIGIKIGVQYYNVLIKIKGVTISGILHTVRVTTLELEKVQRIKLRQLWDGAVSL